MLALWLLSMVVLINAYIGIFTARLAVVKLEPTVDTLEDLAASKTHKMTIELSSEIGLKSMVIFMIFLFQNIQMYQVINDFFFRMQSLVFIKYLETVFVNIPSFCSQTLPSVLF